ncbi:amidase [Auriculariales sp. MPI-PUGE-AT-0066]|nr:amidase [Auriculariales sp. MPI-PUGE-AT-0066]
MLFGGEPKWKVAAKAKVDARARAVDEGLALAGEQPRRRATPNVRAEAGLISQRISSGEWKAGDVVRAYVRRAAKAQELLNCLTEVRFADAIREADALDAAGLGAVTGRLYGMPQHASLLINPIPSDDLAGYDTSVGYTAWTDKPAQQDADVVKLMKEEGAIVLAKTNLSQGLMFMESVNPIFGRTANPYDRDRTAGGSSGGEAALLACDGSALGIGSDSGGSVRLPALWCGIYAFKPTSDRISAVGLEATNCGFESLAMVAGPMARTLSDIRLLCEISFGRVPQMRTSQAISSPVPFRHELAKLASGKRLRLGYYAVDGVAFTSPPVQRAVNMTVDALRADGHEMIELSAQDIDLMRVVEVFLNLTTCGGTSGMDPVQQAGEPVEREVMLLAFMEKLPGVVRVFVSWLAEKVTGDPHAKRNINAVRIKKLPDLFSWTLERNKCRQYWHDEGDSFIWIKHGLAAIIAPQQAVPAPLHGATGSIPQIASAALYTNVLDYPVGAIPVLSVDPAIDNISEENLPPQRGEGGMVNRPLYHGQPGTPKVYDTHAMSGLPVGIQVIGQRWDDERVIAVMEVIDVALNNAGRKRFGPGTWHAKELPPKH